MMFGVKAEEDKEYHTFNGLSLFGRDSYIVPSSKPSGNDEIRNCVTIRHTMDSQNVYAINDKDEDGIMVQGIMIPKQDLCTGFASIGFMEKIKFNGLTLSYENALKLYIEQNSVTDDYIAYLEKSPHHEYHFSRIVRAAKAMQCRQACEQVNAEVEAIRGSVI